jgi:hypothetical protein
MKKMMTGIAWMIAGLVLACFWPATTHAQAETTPEDYKSSNMAPITPAPSMKADFQGNFSLPFQVQCGGHKLAPGQYTLAVKTVGESKMVTIQRDGSDIVLPVRRVSQASASGKSVVMVRHGPGPRTRTLEGLYVENLNMVLYLDESGHMNRLDKMFASVKRLPIS